MGSWVNGDVSVLWGEGVCEMRGTVWVVEGLRVRPSVVAEIEWRFLNDLWKASILCCDCNAV
jgi:hypothetical protein